MTPQHPSFELLILAALLATTGGCGGPRSQTAASSSEVQQPSGSGAEASPAPATADYEGGGGAPREEAEESAPSRAAPAAPPTASDDWEGPATSAPREPDSTLVYRMSPADRTVVLGFDDDLTRYESDLADALSGSVDCAAADELKDAVCLLAERICEIANRHPDDPTVTDRCTRGTERCRSATEDVDAVCG